MKILEFDFGADARYLNLKTPIEKIIFTDSFLFTPGFDLSDFYEGRRYFVHGLKGSGKSALLQYIRVKAEGELRASCQFYHFQSTFSSTEIQVFKANLSKSRNIEDIVIDDTELTSAEDLGLFWRMFILIEVGKLLRRGKIDTPAVHAYLKVLEVAKAISRAKHVTKRYPFFTKILARLAKDPYIQLEVDFKDAKPEDLDNYLEIAEQNLGDVYLEHSPIFLLVDEMEVYRSGGSGDDLHFRAVASLVRAIRDFNERFTDVDIRVIAAIRSEVITQVSRVQGEVHRIIRDRGLSIGWEEKARGQYHPLEKMILGRMVAQDSEFRGYSTPISDDELTKARKKYFPQENLLKKCLDLTWYRPRDFAILFDEARLLDANLGSFRATTLTKDVVGKLGVRLWQDAVSGLSVKYSPRELDGLDRILRGGPERYNRSAFIARISILSDQYDDVALLSEKRWTEMLEDLYRVWVVFAIAKGTGHLNFYFRGDPMPPFTDAFDVGVHQTLRGELSTIRS